MTGAYVPPAGDDWATVAPAEAGFDPARLRAAIDFMVANETSWPRDIMVHLKEGHFEPPPWNEIVGPVRDRGGPNGIVLRGGRIVAEWGDTRRADMTFSVSKSYLSTCAGIAFDRGLIADLDRPVAELLPDCPGFDGPHNARITFRHLLQQTSEWEGTLWGKPDLVDRNRQLGPGADNARKGEARPLRAPGTYWEYNDVRVNQAALATLHALRRPLPEVLREAVMDPIGASSSWEWHGYSTSWTELDGRRVQSVSGGGHWGGGLFISSRDHARFGLLIARGGVWGGRRLLSERWLDLATRPCDANPLYGCMWWLNTGRRQYPSAPAASFSARGAGASLIWIDREHDLVAVIRWIDPAAIDGFLARLLAAFA